jgi:hypothetical protein
MDQFIPERYSQRSEDASDSLRSRLKLWTSFCRTYRVAEDSVPLFECDENGFVQTKEVAKARPRKLLRRSAVMETIMRQESRKVVDDHNKGNGLYDGIIYIMHTRGTDGVTRLDTLGSQKPWVRLLEFYRSTSRVLKQIHQSLADGATTMPTTSEFRSSSWPRNTCSATKISTLGRSAL